MPVCARAIVLRSVGYTRDSITYRGNRYLHTNKHGKFHYDGTPVNPPRTTMFGAFDPIRLILPNDPEWPEALAYVEREEERRRNLKPIKRIRRPTR